MAIVCGVDFSEMSGHALKVAGLLAGKLKAPLHLVHAAPSASTGSAPALIDRWHEHRLEERAAQLREQGLEVFTHVAEGSPEEIIAELANDKGGTLVVTAASARGRNPLGQHADRIARSVHVPVLTVRDAAPFREWLLEERPLRIALGLDRATSSTAAVEFVRTLRACGPCDVTAFHMYVPPQEFERFGLGGPRNFLAEQPEVIRALEREYAALLSHLGSDQVKRRFLPSIGSIGERLAVLGAEEGADLIVVGSRSREPHLWQASVSREVLHAADTSVACVPEASLAAQPVRARELRSIIAATDFSEAGNAAVALAHSVVQAGGTVHVVHVENGPQDLAQPSDVFVSNAQHREAFQKLQALGPAPRHRPTPSTTTLHILRSNDVARAICQAAERLNADLLCMGTQGRTGLARVVLGSVAQSVLKQTRRPVLFSRGDDAVAP